MAQQAVKVLEDEWEPNPFCSDRVRRNQENALRTGDLDFLVFDGATVRREKNGLLSVQIMLKSSKRLVAVRVTKNNGDLKAEILVDKKL